MDSTRQVVPISKPASVAVSNTYYGGLKVMVTGGLGFIGSNVAKRLVELGADVLVIDSLQANTGGNPANLKGFENKLDVRLMDLSTCLTQPPEMFKGVRAVFNLAGNISHIDSMNDPISDMGSNVHAQLALLEACRRHAPDARIVFASTRQIYGRPISFPVDESHALNPVDVNGINKAAAEAYHLLYHRVHGLPTVSLRLTNTYGPGMRIKDARQTFLGVWLRRVVEDGAFEVWGGHQLRDFTYIKDVVESFLIAGWCAAAVGKAFNIGGGPPISLFELAELLVKVGGSGRFEFREFPPERLRIDIGDYFADDRLFRELTGWQPAVTLREGLAETLSYYRCCLEDYV